MVKLSRFHITKYKQKRFIMSYKYVLNQYKLFLLLPPFCNGLISICKSMNFSWFNAHNQKEKYRG